MPCVFHAQRVLGVIGMSGVLALSAGGYMLRALAYVAIDDARVPWFVLLTEPFHAVTFSVTIATTGVYARNTAKLHAPGAAGSLAQAREASPRGRRSSLVARSLVARPVSRSAGRSISAVYAFVSEDSSAVRSRRQGGSPGA